MRFDDLSARLRSYETASDRRTPPGFHMLSRVDCRIAELPDVDRVVDDFRWRADDAARNRLNALRAAGRGDAEATALAGLGLTRATNCSTAPGRHSPGTRWGARR